jgi:hypothetical protein
MTEKADTDDDIAFQSETLLSLIELFLKARAAAEGNNRMFPYNTKLRIFSLSFGLSWLG